MIASKWSKEDKSRYRQPRKLSKSRFLIRLRPPGMQEFEWGTVFWVAQRFSAATKPFLLSALFSPHGNLHVQPNLGSANDK
jgi:hypothetical protein